MKKNKIGSIFLVSVLALAGIGISYAGFSDMISVYGEVNTATVQFNVVDYSGTDVWKVYGDGQPAGEIFIGRSFESNKLTTTHVEDMYPDCTVIPVASSWASVGSDYDVDMLWDNIFPCVDFTADVIIHYEGSIPAHVTVTDLVWDANGYDFSEYLTFEAYSYVKDGDEWIKGEQIDFPVQMHFCDHIGIEAAIHLEQNNELQGLSGGFSFNIHAIQWTDDCEVEEPDLSILKTVDDPRPYIGDDVVFTITVTNHGPGSATGVVVEDILPLELIYVSSTATQGSYNPITGLWTVGSLSDGDNAILELTTTVTSPGSYEGFVELGLILDGSGSISGSDWTIMKEGLADAILNNIPDDGSVELTVVQFSSTGQERVELDPTVITAANKDGVANIILAMVQLGSLTNMESGFVLCADTMVASSNHQPSNRQVINLVTDGYPNEGDAVAGRNYLINTLGMTEDQDEIDSEAVGPGADAIYLRDNIVYPQPGNIAPPFIPGWVYPVSSYSEFSEAIGEKFTVIFSSIENCATIVGTNLMSCVTITPQSADCPPPLFTEIDLETSIDQTDWIDIPQIEEIFQMTLSGDNAIFHYLNLGDGTTTNVALVEGYYGFFLDTTTLPVDFYQYWSDRGVYDGCPGTWEPTMWEIISGNQPMFYVKYTTPSTFMLVDGLQYLLGQGDNYLRVHGDYPLGEYSFTGTIYADCGSYSEIMITVEFINGMF